MKDKPENFDNELERIAEELEADILKEIDEAAALSLCFPLTQVGNDSLGRLKKYAEDTPLMFWRWVSEKFPEHEPYWKPGLDKAMGSEQPESDRSGEANEKN
jgi:hypothetical protein